MKKLRTVLLFQAVVLIAACSQFQTSNRVNLYNEFSDYKKLVVEDYDLAAKTKVSREFLEFNIRAQNNMPDEFRSPFLIDIADKIQAEKNHFEKVSGDNGCLTINGIDAEGRPKSLSLYYIVEDGNWVFDYFLIDVHNNTNEYLTEASCPPPEKFQTL